MTFQGFDTDSCRSLEPAPAIATPLTAGLLTFLLTTSSLGLLGASFAPSLAVAQQPEAIVAQNALSAAIIYVNPAFGRDAADAGSEAAPFRSITYALQWARAGTVIKLARGSYTPSTGEAFPLALPPGVILRGEEQTKGQTVAIIGGGNFISPTFARQNATILAGKDTDIRGIAVTNPNVRGTGIWIESTNPKIQNSTFNRNNRDGIFVTGTANPSIRGNLFTKNEGNGISVARNATGDIHDNDFQDTGFGLAIGGNSAPVVSGNRITGNIDGIYINDAARPILRSNVIENNKRDGLVATVSAKPDLGTADSAGNNTMRNNGKFDINNATSGTLYSVGNRVDTSRIAGRMEFVAPAIADGGGATAFRDIQGHWAQGYIEALVKRNVLTGFPDGTFRPGEPVTRVQFAVIVAKAFAPPPRLSRSAFKDVASNFWGNQAIQTAIQGGFMKGYPGGLFQPNQAIPRVQALVSLANGLNFGFTNANVLSVYQDARSIPAYATVAVASATQRQVVVNYPTLNQLNPNRPATRAEVAAFVYQALVNAGKAQSISSAYVVVP